VEGLRKEALTVEESSLFVVAAFRYLLLKLEGVGMVVWSIDNALSLIPMTSAFRGKYLPPQPEQKVRASRFALLRSEAERLFLESPLSHAKIVLENPLYAAVWGLLATPKSTKNIVEALSLPAEEVQAALGVMVMGGVAGIADEEGKISEDYNDTLRVWSHSDALFHSRSRKGRHEHPYGAQFPFLGEIEEPPARKPPLKTEITSLPTPDRADVEQNNRPLLDTMTMRSSKRKYDEEHPLTKTQLGHFLYWTSRSLKMETALGVHSYTAVRKPYPTGGAMGELEVYVIVNVCEGLAAGAYHYDSWEHGLRRVEGDETQSQAILLGGQQSMGITEYPPLMLILASRTPRLMWKYCTIPYACTLKHVGIVFQTWYLVATAMGLAACAIGGGDSEAFSRLTGYSIFEETSVGEFVLGAPQRDSLKQTERISS
jgi:SagB-type dehydrogenase family enzyme